MIGVTVRQDKSQKTGVDSLHAGDLGQKRYRILVPSIERQSEVEQDALAVTCEFDACAADLARAAVNANAEAPRRSVGRNGYDAHMYLFT